MADKSHKWYQCVFLMRRQSLVVHKKNCSSEQHCCNCIIIESRTYSAQRNRKPFPGRMDNQHQRNAACSYKGTHNGGQILGPESCPGKQDGQKREIWKHTYGKNCEILPRPVQRSCL